MPPSPITTLADYLRFAQSVPPGRTVAELRANAEIFRPIINHEPLPPLKEIIDDQEILNHAGRRLAADIFVPIASEPTPVILFVHGGGWIAGSTKTYRRLAARLASLGFLVVSLEYRLSPETRWPGPVRDVVDAVPFVRGIAARHNADANRLVFVGDSCGANLAAAAAIWMSEHRLPHAPSALALLYGIYSIPQLIGTFADVPGDGYLTRSGVKLMTESYLSADDRAHALRTPTLSPLFGAERLPPTSLLCGGADPLLSQTTVMADALRARGVPSETVIVPDMPHGFCQIEFYPQTIPSVKRAASFLHAHAARP